MNLLITRLLNVFGEPDSPDPAAYLRELEMATKGVPDNLLRAAGDRVMRTHRSKAFPSIGVITSAVDEERQMSRIGTVPRSNWLGMMPPVPVADYDDETKERWRKAEQFQKEMADKYGSFDAFLSATRHVRDDCNGKKPMVSKRSSFKTLSETSIRMTGEKP